MKMRKFAALMLTLCMMLSLSISAFAASDTIASGTIPDSKIKWELDSHGWLTISGSGEAPVFQSADDQPWVEYREQITEVWFEAMEALNIPDLAYWFEGCVNLITAELPLAPVIGNHAFYGCDNLNTITMYYGETVLKSIGEDAFWREADAGDTLYIAYIIGYPEATVPFYTYDWAASNRSNRYFYDLYGVYQNADAATAGGIKKAPAQVSTRASTGIVGTCPSCKKNSLQGTYVSQSHTYRGHAEYYECYLCHYVQNLGTYVYKDTVPARMVRGLARTAAAIHGCCKVSRQLPAPAMDTVRILAPAVRPRAKPFTPAAIVTVMEAGNSIRPASTGAQALAGTAVRRTMTTLRTA